MNTVASRNDQIAIANAILTGWNVGLLSAFLTVIVLVLLFGVVQDLRTAPRLQLQSWSAYSTELRSATWLRAAQLGGLPGENRGPHARGCSDWLCSR